MQAPRSLPRREGQIKNIALAPGRSMLLGRSTFEYCLYPSVLIVFGQGLEGTTMACLILSIKARVSCLSII